MSDLVIKETYNASANAVWKALTDINEIKKWYIQLEEFRAEVGFQFSFVEQNEQGRKFNHICKVTEVIPLKRLQYSWRYEGYSGNSLVTFDLEEIGNKTMLTLTHSGLDTFPKDAIDLRRENFQKGWTALLAESLTNYLKEL